VNSLYSLVPNPNCPISPFPNINTCVAGRFGARIAGSGLNGGFLSGTSVTARPRPGVRGTDPARAERATEPARDPARAERATEGARVERVTEGARAERATDGAREDRVIEGARALRAAETGGRDGSPCCAVDGPGDEARVRRVGSWNDNERISAPWPLIPTIIYLRLLTSSASDLGFLFLLFDGGGGAGILALGGDTLSFWRFFEADAGDTGISTDIDRLRRRGGILGIK
jgi:hypothetical protein